jgi:hypothetical protein
MKGKRRFKMDKLKLIMACAALGVIVYQVQLMGGKAQRKYYAPQGKTSNPEEAAANIQERREAALEAQAAAGEAPTGACTGGSCPFVPRKTAALSPQQAEAEALRRRIAELEAKVNALEAEEAAAAAE